MGEEFYAIIKLVSGEEILSLVLVDENDGDPVLVLQNPVTIKIIQSAAGSFIKVKPWIELSNENFFIIKLDKIITITETTDENIINVFNSYVEDNEDGIDFYTPSGQVKVSNKMGYLSSVEEARKKLEKIFKDIKES